MNAQSKIEAPPNVHKRLNNARREFHSLKLKKSGKFPKGRGDYFELGDFIIPALTAFDNAGLCGEVSFPDGEAVIDIVNVEDESQVIRLRSPMGSANLPGCHEVQNIGAVQTYQRRYLWMMALEIVEHDAIDGSLGEYTPAKEQEKPEPTITDEQLEKLEIMIPAAKLTPAQFCQSMSCATVKALPASKYQEAINRINDRMATLAKKATNKEAEHA